MEFVSRHITLNDFFLKLVILLTITSYSHSDWELNMTESATAIGRDIHGLHMTIFYICVAIAVVVFGIMLYSIVRHRKSLGAEAQPFHESTLVEIIWTTVPLLILVAMAIPATKTLIAMYDTETSDIDIKVTGYQWKWRYEYLNTDVDFFSTLTTTQDQMHGLAPKSENYLLEVDKHLVIPINKKIRFLFTAQDVIHSWWVPELAVKKDAIPGFINESWAKVETPGIYRGQCAELCGQGHGYMPIVVEAVSEEDYQAWLISQQQAQISANQVSELSFDELMTQGKTSYDKNCAACHQVSGLGIPPVFPALKGSAIALGDIKNHVDIVVNGKTGTSMAAFGEQLTPTEIAAIVTYERNAWDNNKGDSIQPAEIVSFKQAQGQ
ncbi:MAG: cytochrome c oxidase subunit 2 [Psychromonas sp.]|jgi:cytochrome c oxidase subunit 2